MRGLLVTAVLVSVWAPPVRAESSSTPKAVCQRAAQTVTKLIGATDKAQTLLGRRCERDRWSRNAQACFASATTRTDAQFCLDKLNKEQRTQLEGDADRLGEPKLVQWLSRRVQIASTLPPTVTLAVLQATPQRDKARVLHDQGLSAYKAGRYDSAVRKFSAALDADQQVSPELIYHAAQAHRLKGNRAKAMELYEQYLEVAPRGAAANACRAELDKLRDVPQ
jgi:tetratricopeptide (TPR) repeat protein